MAENRRGKDRGLYYLSKGQLFILAVGFTATSVIVFLLGVLIGQGIEEGKLLKKEEPLVKLPVKSLPKGAASEGGEKNEITFYDTLPQGSSGSQPVREKSAKKGAAVKPAVKETKETKVAVKEAPPAPAKKAEEKKAAPPKASAEVKKKTPSPKPAERVEQKAQAQAQNPERPWTVQINAYPHEWDATRLAKQLKEKGYDAYVTTYTDTKGRSWYRVRVGHLDTQVKAKELQEKLKTKEKMTDTFATSRP